MSKKKKLTKVMTAYIVDNDVLSDTLILRDENTKKNYMFDTFRSEVNKVYRDEMMVAVVDGNEIEFFNERGLRSIMRENRIESCRVNYYHFD